MRPGQKCSRVLKYSTAEQEISLVLSAVYFFISHCYCYRYWIESLSLLRALCYINPVRDESLTILQLTDDKQLIYHPQIYYRKGYVAPEINEESEHK